MKYILKSRHTQEYVVWYTREPGSMGNASRTGNRTQRMLSYQAKKFEQVETDMRKLQVKNHTLITPNFIYQVQQ